MNVKDISTISLIAGIAAILLVVGFIGLGGKDLNTEISRFPGQDYIDDNGTSATNPFLGSSNPTSYIQSIEQSQMVKKVMKFVIVLGGAMIAFLAVLEKLDWRRQNVN
ncbi:MAG: hypothetical protein BTN85_1135 [Candidatus Methanohalarchaeum thermophilum]|uniref:Uncharacterized protein n=1 Tax=Methanohalarchaeum thermophilum TaxID=1903181 RepID=A0A1Q6DWC3_METT1|nr:MAG: hypothetical protein BTN85_1135 [Candidatus Methanohalarchaeum thermophilum]